MRYRDRKGNEFEQTTGQDELLAKLYGSTIGRGAMKIASLPIFSKLMRFFLDGRLSSAFVLRFAERNDIDIFDFENRKYYSFNDFFIRKIKPGRRRVDRDKNVIITPSDGKISAYRITNSSEFVVKNSVYTVGSLLRDSKLAERYNGGTAIIIRLSPDDYHRYCYCADGEKSRNRTIKGVLHTVNPIANKYLPVYKENCREYCIIRTKNFGDIIQINSKSGLEGSKANFAYAGSKFGGLGLVQSFALELAPYRIKVNGICPGNFLDGPLWSDPVKGLYVQYLNAGKVPGAKTVDDVREYYLSKVPMHKGCNPSDVTKGVLYLIEQTCETGQALPITGGQVMLK